MSGSEPDDLVQLNDPRLDPLLRAGGEGIDREIECIIVTHVQPLVGAILSRFRSSQGGLADHDAADVASNVNLRLVRKLRALASSPEDVVLDFESYVAALTYNAVHDHLRTAFPARARLKNRLRYTLRHDARLALWTQDGAVVCGLRAWRETAGAATEIGSENVRVSGAGNDPRQVAEAMLQVFTAAGRPVLLESLVAFFAEVWNVADHAPVSTETIGDQPSALPGTADDLETRETVRALWREVRELRPRQRQALLLNLRSGESTNVISVFVRKGIAGFDEVAAAVEMSPEELAAVWNELPFDDHRIASLLGVTRQQVINLRKSARERLSRRMAR
ncbi:MAG TPA: hypothetical protein VEK57_03770 [Thermoanaerobaculia bacterium]|nr:hypothetical protein [Thermoanaerobaculia bacterium]